MSLYPKNDLPFSEAVFQNPGSEYRGTPFWAWNHHLDEETIRQQVGYFKEMGMGGYHAHVRTGLDTPYLGEEFMQMMKAALDEAKEKGLLHWLYDEDRWPSGAAGGLVTKNPDYAQKKLLFTAFPKSEEVPFPEDHHFQHGLWYELGRYKVELVGGELVGFQRLAEGPADWYAYLYLTPKSPWYNNESYLDTLKKEAVEEFLRVTHDTYAAWFQEDFGKTIPAIFTDEPQFARKETLKNCEEKQEISIPFTDDLEETFYAAYGTSLLDHLPELFWEWADGHVSFIRYAYHDHVCERFASAFADPIGAWCRAHGLMLTGHMMEEPTLNSQTGMLGEAMRSYRGFGLPGIDMLCDRREYTTAKQACSASRQLGCPGVLSELYGVTNWDFDFRGHKLQGDWQAALGVTTRVHHLTWMSMQGEAKRDYPACIGFQSPWFREYKQVEDHFARVNTAMTRGKADVRIGVLHPIESYWLYFGSNEKTGMIRAEMDEQFEALCRWLLSDALDFDYISESMLASFVEQPLSPSFQVGEMAYDVVIVPPMKTIRSTTLQRLRRFQQAGGKILFLGEEPSLVDARPSSAPKELMQDALQVPFTKTRILESLAPWREIELVSRSGFHETEAGMHTQNLFYQLRKDQDEKWLFIAHSTPMRDPDLPYEEEVEIRIRGSWKVEWYQTQNGLSCEIPASFRDGNTVVRFAVYEHDSLLFRLIPADAEDNEKVPETIHLHETADENTMLPIPAIVPVKLEEPNVLLLDMARFRLDEGDWQPEEEILRLDNEIREQLGYPVRKKEVAQPWTMEAPEKTEHKVAMAFTLDIRTPQQGLQLALENRADTILFLDGEPVSNEKTGFYIDPCMETVSLPDLAPGLHELMFMLPFGPKTNLENAFLLGDFSVHVQGRKAYVAEPIREAAFGDLSVQGLPFYGGNITYEIPLHLPQDREVLVEATKFRAPVWSAALDQGEPVPAPYAPYTAILPQASAGEHTLYLKCYGNRINTFGQVHNCDETMDWFGPDSWRTEGPAWSYEYHLHRTGVLKSPEISLKK